MTKENQESEIVIYDAEQTTALDIFVNGGVDPLIEELKKKVDNFEADVTTEKGRKAYKSFARKIGSAKLRLDEAGVELNKEYYDKIKKVNEERKRIASLMQPLQEEARRPVTEWENRIKGHQNAIAEFQTVSLTISNQWDVLSIEEMENQIKLIKMEERDWQEFSVKAANEKEKAINIIQTTIDKRKKHDKDQAELLRLQKEEEERKQKEHERLIAEAAAEAARKEVEERAAREKAEAEARVIAEQKAAQERELMIQKEKEQAESRAKEAEQARIRQEVKAKEDAEQALIKAKEDAERAAKAERERIEAEQRLIEEEKAKREANKKNREKKQNKATEDLFSLFEKQGLDYATAYGIVQAISEGKISNITINY